jgi:hypothetical protein
MIDKTIFLQTLIYFSLPVMLALIHPVIGVTVVNKEISTYSQIDIRSSALIFVVVYTGYKNIVKNSI